MSFRSTISALIQDATTAASLRLELFLEELQYEKARIQKSLWLALCGFALLPVALLTALATLALAVPESDRVLVMGIAAFVIFLLAAGCLFLAYSISTRKKLFEATGKELKKDKACLESVRGN